MSYLDEQLKRETEELEKKLKEQVDSLAFIKVKKKMPDILIGAIQGVLLLLNLTLISISWWIVFLPSIIYGLVMLVALLISFFQVRKIIKEDKENGSGN